MDAELAWLAWPEMKRRRGHTEEQRDGAGATPETLLKPVAGRKMVAPEKSPANRPVPIGSRPGAQGRIGKAR
jgi:hypothetical protein